MTLSPASSRSSGGGGGGGALALLATVTPADGDLIIDFAAIPATCHDLILVASLRTYEAAASDTLGIQVNVDGGADYDDAVGTLSGGGGFALSGHTYADTSAAITVHCPAANANNADYGGFELTLLDYANTTRRKFGYVLGSSFDDTDIFGTITPFHWRLTAAVNELTVFSRNGAGFVVGSVARLYGRT